MLAVKKPDAQLDIQRRIDSRIDYLEECFIQSNSHALWARSINLSDGGMCIEFNEYGVLKSGTNIAVFIQNFSPIDAQVRWVRGNIAGVKFLTSVENHPEIYGLLSRLQKKGKVRPNLTPKDIDAKLPTSLREIFVSPPTEDESAPVGRAYNRLSYKEKCHIKTDKRTFQAESHDISEGGMCLSLLGLGKVDLGANIQVILPGGYPPIDASLRWIKDRKIGVEFNSPIKGHPIFFAVDNYLDQQS